MFEEAVVTTDMISVIMVLLFEGGEENLAVNTLSLGLIGVEDREGESVGWLGWVSGFERNAGVFGVSCV